MDETIVFASGIVLRGGHVGSLTFSSQGSIVITIDRNGVKPMG